MRECCRSSSVTGPDAVSTVLPSAQCNNSSMSFTTTSAMPISTASSAEYAFASNTVASKASTFRPRFSAIPRRSAAASSLALTCSVSPKSSPCPPTTAAAPISVTGAIAKIFAAAPINVPALAAWAPEGET